MKRLAALLLLAACDGPVSTMPPENAVIEVSSSGFSGGSATQIFADGHVIRTTIAPGGGATSTTSETGPAAFAAAQAVIAAEGRRTKSAVKPPSAQCLDYGIDLVRADPPISGFDEVSSGCPDVALAALMDHVLASLAVR